ncbi:hypothetical protein DAPPUDRAFT_233923 [Daphnia pulex]|uniref:Uncharacterized protein n=1 Tax=Daphnia pulex TaxID=6669 RepID=E9FW44_DAPPU|nr:hypothetical protein DAPPUDRAFT_233923 [Daphnia pulex]|eukprot:EFX88987.1 hypothetical protein DAPPUDRAFT_233923 [Daphnia pulex]
MRNSQRELDGVVHWRVNRLQRRRRMQKLQAQLPFSQHFPSDSSPALPESPTLNWLPTQAKPPPKDPFYDFYYTQVSQSS